MKNKAHNIASVLAAILFLWVMGFTVAVAMGYASLGAIHLLTSGAAIFEAFSLLLAGVLFSTIPALLFIGCMMAFVEFLGKLSNG